jgi:hypothetical protein
MNTTETAQHFEAPTAPATTIGPETPWYDIFGALIASHVFPSDICRRICLYGRPGTGKSGAAWYGFGADSCERITLYNSMAPDDLLGSWVLKPRDGGTDMSWVHGPGGRSFNASHNATSILILDEVDKGGPDVETALHQILDDQDMARILLPDGQTLTPGAAWGGVGTMNGSPEDLSDALRDRFDVFLNCDTAAPGVLAGMSARMQALVKRTIAESPAVHWRPTITPRRGRAFCRLETVWGAEAAAAVHFGPAAPDVLTMLATCE